jgi:hypothetical protein
MLKTFDLAVDDRRKLLLDKDRLHELGLSFQASWATGTRLRAMQAPAAKGAEKPGAGGAEKPGAGGAEKAAGGADKAGAGEKAGARPAGATTDPGE